MEIYIIMLSFNWCNIENKDIYRVYKRPESFYGVDPVGKYAKIDSCESRKNDIEDFCKWLEVNGFIPLENDSNIFAVTEHEFNEMMLKC